MSYITIKKKESASEEALSHCNYETVGVIGFEPMTPCL